MPSQIALGLSLDTDVNLKNYFVSRDNEAAYSHLQAWLAADATSEPTLYLHGVSGVGKSHLLQGACQSADAEGKRTAYFPGLEIRSYEAASVLEALENIDLVCLDDVEALIGDSAWEEALFHWLNRSRASGAKILLAADSAPRSLDLNLEDLRSRLGWGLVFKLHPLDDEGLEAMIQLRARERGLSLDDELARYIIRRAARGPQALTDLLERLDTASLEAQRQLTQPFVKRVMGW